MTLCKKLSSLLLSSALVVTSTCAQADSSGDQLQDLLALNIEALSQIEISVASKRSESIFEAPSVVTVVTRDDIERYGSLDLFDIIRRLPNVDISEIPLMPSIGVNLRGQVLSGSHNHVLFLIDGRPFRESQLGGWDQALLRAFPVESVDHIEMIRGPGSVLYGTNAFSGVINIVTKKAEEHSNTSGSYGSVGYGSFNTRMTEASHRETYGEKLNVSAAVKYLDSDGWNRTYTDRNNVRDSADMTHDAFGAYVRTNYDDLTLSAFEGHTKSAAASVFPVWPIGVHKQKRHFLDIGYEHDINDTWRGNVNVTYNAFRNIATQNQNIIDKNDFHDTLFEASVSGSPIQNLNIVIGGTYDHRQGTLEVGQSDFAEALMGLYSQVDYRFSKHFKLIGGVTLNQQESQEVADVSPRVATIINLDQHNGVKLMYGEAFRSPNGAENKLDLPSVTGNEDVKPEKIKTAEIQLFHDNKDLHLALTGYRSKVEDTITISPNPNAPPALTYLNNENIYFHGVEFEGRYLVNQNIEIQGSATYQFGENRSLDDGTEISNSPHLMIKFGGSYHNDLGYSLGLFNQYYGDVVKYKGTDAAVSEENPEVKSYNLLTANLNINLNKALDLGTSNADWSFTLYGDNLLDEDIRTPSVNAASPLVKSTPAYSGRAVYGRISVKF